MHQDSNGVFYFDVPGESDEVSYHNIQHICAIQQMHLIFIVYTERIEQILKLVRLVEACGTPIIVLRNKTESLSQNDINRAYQVEKKKLDDLNLNCGPIPLYFISASFSKGLEPIIDKIKNIAQS